MGDVHSSVSLLRFRAGPMLLGIAAEDVVQIDKIFDNDTVHIASLLGVEPSGGECRTIRLPRPPEVTDGPDLLDFLADAPLEVLHCDPDRFLPLPRGTSFQQWKPVMGFARIQEQLVLILDIPSLFSNLTDRYQRGLS